MTIQIGSYHDERPGITYVVQLIKFYDRKFETGTVVKEFVLEKGHKNHLIFNVR